MSHSVAFFCWSMLFFSGLLPLSLGVMRRIFIKFHGSFKSSFRSRIRGYFFRSMRDNVNAPFSAENFWIVLVGVLAFLFSGSPTKLLFDLFPAIKI